MLKSKRELNLVTIEHHAPPEPRGEFQQPPPVLSVDKLSLYGPGPAHLVQQLFCFCSQGSVREFALVSLVALCSRVVELARELM